MWSVQPLGRKIERQNWAQLLLFLYSREEKWETFGRGDPPIIESDHPLVERTNLNKTQVKSALSFLEDHELIEEDGSGFFKLTPKGFDVAHEREMKERELQSSRLIVVLTVVLAIGAISQTVVGFQSLGLPLLGLILSGSMLIVIGYAIGYLKHN